ncbi:zinc finger, CCHC-type containing protein [Tanacetum coccineum]|uniref:Zinc finger, CCHC-type containing protein n=1 Tax=Tanacetum coccineum TaxID=301880 RepID=A0ABQ5BBN3_9ASTR
MVAAAIKHMASNFAKLDKFKGVDFRDQIKRRNKWDNDDYVCRGLNTSKVMSDLLFDIYPKGLIHKMLPWNNSGRGPIMEQYNELLGILGRFTQHKMNMDEAIQVSCIIDKLPPSWKDFKHTLKHQKEELTLVELGSHLCIEESLMMQDSDKPKGNNVAGPSVVNMMEHNNSFRCNDNKGKCKHHDTKADPNKKSKMTCWKYGKPRHLKKDYKGGKVGNKANGSSTNASVNGSSNSLKAFMSTTKLNDLIIWHARLGHIHFNRMQDIFKDGLFPAFDMDTKKCKTCMMTKMTKKPFQNVKRETKVLELIHSDLCDLHATPSLGNKKYFVTFINDASRFYVIEPNELVSINSIIESRDAIFDDNRFSSVPRPNQRSPINRIEYISGSVVPEEVIEEDDPKTFDEAMKSQDVAFWKEAINDEMDSIMGNNNWVLADLSSGCKPLGIDYFDTYAPVTRISTIRLMIALASIQNLIIHQMDVKMTFLNGELDEEVYMNQPQGFIMPGNKDNVCKLINSLYGLKQAPKQWNQKFDEVVLSNGYLLNQANKCVYSKFDESGKGVIIFLYVDDMLIFGTDQVQVDLTKKFLSSRFSIKDMGEAGVILGIRIKHESNGITISQSHYIEKAVSQLKYFRVIGCLMYAMTCTRPAIAFAVGKLSSLIYTSYPSVLEGYTNASWISNTKDNSSTSSWVFLLGGGVISWASKKQNCITSSTMESEFVALATAGKEAEWLRNLILEIPLWSKPTTPISICRIL